MQCSPNLTHFVCSHETWVYSRFQVIMRSRANCFFFIFVLLLKMSAFSRSRDIFVLFIDKNNKNTIRIIRKKMFLPSFALGIQYVLVSVRIHGDVFRGASLWINQKLLRMLAQSYGRIWAFGQKAVSSLMQMLQQSKSLFTKEADADLWFLFLYSVTTELSDCC